MIVYFGWNFFTDLGHNFYVTWKTAGIGAAARGLWADFKTSTTALGSGFVSTIKERVGPIVGALKKMFGF
jgi:hypothetical protein